MTPLMIAVVTAILALVIVFVLLLFCVWRIADQSVHLSRTASAIVPADGQAVSVRIDSLDKRTGDDAERLRRMLTETDQGIRERISSSVQQGMEAAFKRLQEGAQSQAESLGSFGKELREGLSSLRERVESLTPNMTTLLDGFQATVVLKLMEADKNAAEARAELLNDLRGAIDKVRENTELSLRAFGEQQGLHLQAVSEASNKSAQNTAIGLEDFRKHIGERLDAVKDATLETLQKSVSTLAELKEVMTIAQARTELILTEQRVAVLTTLGDGQKGVTEKLGQDIGCLNDRVRLGFDGFATAHREEQERLRKLVGEKLDEMRAGNEQKLEQMRHADDEQLQSALEKRVGESFQRVADQFAQVQQAIGQVQAVAGDVGDLKRLFANVKARGGWGEGQNQQVLDDILPPGSYETNLRIGDGGEMVEFALRMPIKGADKAVWLPIDAKFPTESYDQLLQAAEAGDRDAEQTARKALAGRIREEAKRIDTKYVKPPLTVEYGVLFLPTEELFSEVSRIPGLVEEVRRTHHVWIVGPSIIPALLHCIRVGHLTLALESKAGAMGETLGAVKAAWSELIKALELTGKRARGLTNQIGKATTKANAVGKALKTVDVIEFERAEQLLGVADGLTVDGSGMDPDCAAEGEEADFETAIWFRVRAPQLK